MSINPLSFDFTKYKSKFKTLDDYFIFSKKIKLIKKNIEDANKYLKYDFICSICLDEIRDNQIIDTFECKHFFHKECLDEWKNNKKSKSEVVNCPNCRKDETTNIWGQKLTYSDWIKLYSGSFSSVTRPPCIYADIEILNKYRYFRYQNKKHFNDILLLIK